MKHSVQRITVAGLVGERLAVLGAANIPVTARQLIEADAVAAVAALIQRRVSGPVVGRAVARALSAPAGTGQGLKGGTPLTSEPWRNSHEGVAGETPFRSTAQAGQTSGGPDQLPTGERL